MVKRIESFRAASGGQIDHEFGPLIDLKTVRATLEYIHGDLARVHRLAPVAEALAKALDELDAVSGRRTDVRFERLVSLPEGRQLR